MGNVRIGDIVISEKEVEVMKETIFSLTEFTCKQLSRFIKINPSDERTEEIKVNLFMDNVLKNYLGNLLLQAVDGEVKDFKDRSDVFIKDLSRYLDAIVPELEKNIAKIKYVKTQSEVH